MPNLINETNSNPTINFTNINYTNSSNITFQKDNHDAVIYTKN